MQCFIFSCFFCLLHGTALGYTKVFIDETRNNLLLKDEYFSCKTDTECENLITGSSCKNEVCKCAEGKLLSSDASKCLPPVDTYGSPCEDTVQCSNLLLSGGVCENNLCTCKSGYHYLKGHCWKNIGLHEECYKNEQCFASYEYVGLECNTNICKCRENYYERLNSGCRRKSKLEEPCNIDTDCPEQSTCENRKCFKVTEELSRSENVPEVGNVSRRAFELEGVSEFRELGMSCTVDSDCSSVQRAVCLDNQICACEPPFYVASDDNRECLKVAQGKIKVISSSSCMKDLQCGVFGPDSFCQNKRCACRIGTYFEPNHYYCWKIKSVGESCSSNEDCHPSANYAECIQTKTGKLCACQKGYHQQDLSCVPDATKLGDPCEEDSDCLFPHSICDSSNVCTCAKNFYPDKGQCKSGVGTQCVSDADCAHLKNTECREELFSIKNCICKTNHTHSEDYKYCLPIANHEEKCEESFQCTFRMGNLGECKDGVCKCNKGTHYYNGTCHKSVFPGQRCTKQPDCFPANDTVICLKGICACNYDYHLIESGICIKTNSATTTKFFYTPLTFLVIFLTLR